MHVHSIDDVSKLLAPKSVAIIGVSSGEYPSYRAGGRSVLEHLLAYGYPGQVFPVHPEAKAIHGLPAYRSVGELPSVPDCAVIAVPSSQVIEVVEQCGLIGIGAALILTAGFSERGPEGQQNERRLVETAATTGVRLLGPNSTGVINVAGSVAMSMTSVLSEGRPLLPGGLALITQSGAIASSLVERARLAEVGVSFVVSVGNECDLGFAEFLSFFASAPEVTAVGVYLEGVRDRESFELAITRLRAADKQAIVLLGGQSKTGQQAAATHTGKTAGNATLELAVLKSLDVHLVEDLDDIWQVGSFASRPGDQAKIDGWGIVTFSGGMGVLAADRIEEAGAGLAVLSGPTEQLLNDFLPDYVAARNPLDVGPGAVGHFGAILRVIAHDDTVTGICVAIPMGADGWHETLTRGIIEAHQIQTKPIVVCWYGGTVAGNSIKLLRTAGVLTVETPSELGRLFRSFRSRKASARPEGGDSLSSPPDSPERFIGGAAALSKLADRGVQCVTSIGCSDVSEALQAAEKVGYPVVLKSGSSSVSHRLERSLVRLDISGPDELRTAVAEIAHQMRALPKDDDEPLLIVQPMVSGGIELVLAVRSAGNLGHFGAVGFGGSAVEIFADTVWIPLPCSPSELNVRIQELRGHRLLTGYRGRLPIDVGWVHETLHTMRECLGEYTEIEVNPAIVTNAGGLAVDALFSVA